MPGHCHDRQANFKFQEYREWSAETWWGVEASAVVHDEISRQRAMHRIVLGVKARQVLLLGPQATA